MIEDDISEAEIFHDQGPYRTYVKARVQCVDGSLLIAVVGPSKAVPTPSVGTG